MALTPAPVNVSALCNRLGVLLRGARSDTLLRQTIVNAPFTYPLEMAMLFLGFISYVEVDEGKRLITHGAASATEHYHRSMDGYNFDLKDYKIPLDDSENRFAQAIVSGKPVATNDWDTLRRPRVHAGVARINQASSGIGYSVIYPLQGKKRGALMYNFFQEQDEIGEAQEDFMNRYTQLVSQALNQRLSA